MGPQMKPVKWIPIKMCMPKGGSPNEFDYCVGINKKVLQTTHVSHSSRQLQNFFQDLRGKFEEVLEVSVL